MPELTKQFYAEGVHELLRVQVVGEYYGHDITIDTRSHTDEKADVELRVETTADGVRWQPAGMMRGLGVGLMHRDISRSVRPVFGAKQADGHRYLDRYESKRSPIVAIRMLAIVHAGTFRCDAVDISVGQEMPMLPAERPRLSIGVTDSEQRAATGETFNMSSTLTTSAGNTIVAGVGKPFSATAAVVTDDNGGSYTDIFTQNSGLAGAYAQNVAGGNVTLTVTTTGAFGLKEFGALCVADVSTSAALANSTSIRETFDNTAPYESTTDSTSNGTGNLLAIGFWKHTGGVGTTMDASGGYTRHVNLADFMMASLAVSGSTGYTATATTVAAFFGAYNVLSVWTEAAAGGATGWGALLSRSRNTRVYQ